MAISKETKEEILSSYLEVLSNAKGIIVTEYRGMAMPNFNATRKVLRENNARYVVSKNTLMRRALRETGFADPEKMLEGPTACVVAHGDLSSAAKAILQRAKEDEKLIVKGAVMGTEIFRGLEGVEMLSTLPTLDEARAMLVGVLQQPSVKLVTLLNTPLQHIANVLQAYADKDKEQGGGDAA